MKKLLMTMGTIGAVALPITAVVACSSKKQDQAAIDNEIAKQIKETEDKAGKSLNALGITDISQWVGEISKAYSQPFIKRLDPNGVLLDIDQVGGYKFYFEKNEQGQQFVNEFRLNDDLSWSAIIYIIEVPYSKSGLDIKGSIRQVSIYVTNAGKLSSYSEQTHAVAAQETINQNAAIVITKNGATMIDLGSSSYKWVVETLFESTIKDETKDATQVEQEIEAGLNRWGITIFSQGSTTFLFNSTTRQIISVALYAKP